MKVFALSNHVTGNFILFSDVSIVSGVLLLCLLAIAVVCIWHKRKRSRTRTRSPIEGAEEEASELKVGYIL